jgi:hypothetical protein
MYSPLVALTTNPTSVMPAVDSISMMWKSSGLFPIGMSAGGMAGAGDQAPP